MTYEFIIVEREHHLTIITINRPAAYNSLNTAAHRELASAFDEFETDDTQWVAILTGAGDKAFCAGYDLKQQASGGGWETPRSGFAGLTARFGMQKPVIAAVNGVAMGGGFEAALACDLIIANQSAVFALPEPRVGIAALAGGLQRLPREIGLKRAMGMLLTGRRVTAQEGLAAGFVNEVVQDELLVSARRWAEQILECSPMSVRATKEAVMRGLSSSEQDAMVAQWEYLGMKALFASEDFIEGHVRLRKSVRLAGGKSCRD
jgi:enoyl-CoA hydratase/carnithine racemase